jgi:hypothetical protein
MLKVIGCGVALASAVILNSSAIAQRLNPNNIHDCAVVERQLDEICASNQALCQQAERFMAACSQRWSAQGEVRPNTYGGNVPYVRPYVQDPEVARMRCESNCSTFGNAYREGGLDQIRECEARCRR